MGATIIPLWEVYTGSNHYITMRGLHCEKPLYQSERSILWETIIPVWEVYTVRNHYTIIKYTQRTTIMPLWEVYTVSSHYTTMWEVYTGCNHYTSLRGLHCEKPLYHYKIYTANNYYATMRGSYCEQPLFHYESSKLRTTIYDNNQLFFSFKLVICLSVS